MSDDRDELMALAERVLARSAVATDEERKMIHDALRSVASAAVPVAVKALEWRDGPPGTHTDIADTVFGQYSAWFIEPHGVWCGPNDRAGNIFGNSLSAAKAAAQADFDQRIRSALVPGGGELVANDAAVLIATYTNYRGETAVRRIIPKSVRYGSTEWHPEPQWLLLAWDDDKQSDREFALKDFGHPTVPSAAVREALENELFNQGVDAAVELASRWSREAAEFRGDPGCAIQSNVCRNLAVALINLRRTLSGLGESSTSSDGGAEAGSSPILASKEKMRARAHGVMPVGDSADASGCTDVGPSEATTEREPPEWLWWGEVNGTDVVTFGRWPKHGARWRYKLADIQPTEHDHAPSTDQRREEIARDPDEPCCPFCGRDPFHRVDNGVGMEAVAVTCCNLGDQFFRGMRPAPETVTIEWDEFVKIGERLAGGRAIRQLKEQQG